MPAPTSLTGRTREAGSRFLSTLAQTVKLISLYKVGHPVPASSVQETWNNLHELFTVTGWDELAVGLEGGRWILNSSTLEESGGPLELLSIVFRSHALTSVTFGSAAKLYELSAFCEMASTPPNRAYQTDASVFLKERGVKHVTVNVEQFVRARRVRQPASALIESPLAGIARRQPSPAGAGGPGAPGGGGPGGGGDGAGVAGGFGSFIKSLVDKAIPDPQERGQLYGEAVRLVEQALARHVSEATHKLLEEKQGAINERMRTENVLAKVADGKVVVDKQGRVLMMDSVAEGIAGKTLSDVAGKPLRESLGSGEQVLAMAKDLVLPTDGPVSSEVDVSGADEVVRAFRQSLALVQDEHGRTLGTYAVPPYATKLKEAMQLQESFIANVTHDLKAPLASICSALEILSVKLGKELGSEDAGFIDISLRNSRQLRQMIDEILDFSKIRSGAMAVNPEPAEPAALLKEAADALRPLAQSRSLTLRAEAPAPGLPRVLADRGRLVQVLANLVSNAVKFTPEGGSIVVSASDGAPARPGAVVFSVRDTGCGISPADQKRIFEKFAQAAGPNRREGVGLGLSIARELVTRHQGELWVESEPGKGATFSFSLPTAP
jgi:signal transduction histidine kinase